MNLKKYFQNYSREKLIREIQLLTTKFPQVKQYYQLRNNQQSQSEVIDAYKKRIWDEFFPKRGFGDGRLSVARKPIQEYQKIAIDQKDVIDLMIFYVETGVNYTLKYGDINEPFYDSMENMFKEALISIKKLNAYHQFFTRCKTIIEDTINTGWGFHDQLSDLFDYYYKET